jgi:predicted ATP-dependent protease
VIPEANAVNLILTEEVEADIAADRFQVWSIRDVDEALALFTGLDGATVAARAQETLDRYDVLMRERAVLWQ